MYISHTKKKTPLLFCGYQPSRSELSNFQYHTLHHTSYVTYNLQIIIMLTVSKLLPLSKFIYALQLSLFLLKCPIPQITRFTGI